MGDYNADANPGINKLTQVAFGYQLAPLKQLKVDQFSTATANKVYNLTKKIGKTRLRILVDPSQIPTP